MEDNLRNEYLNMAKGTFLFKLGLINYKAAKWLQYNGFELDEKLDRIKFKFKTSTYGISFEVEVRAYLDSTHYDNVYKDLHDFDYVYKYFRDLKYDNLEKQD